MIRTAHAIRREIQDSVTVDKLAVVFYSRSCLLYLGRIGARVKIMVLICGKRTSNSRQEHSGIPFSSVLNVTCK